jgi:hypothetical protein
MTKKNANAITKRDAVLASLQAPKVSFRSAQPPVEQSEGTLFRDLYALVAFQAPELHDKRNIRALAQYNMSTGDSTYRWRVVYMGGG